MLAACTPGAAGAASTATAHPLVVYSSEGYDAVVAQYFRQRTGIPVQLVTDKLDTLASRIQATKSHPQWGVFWADGPTVMASLDGQHLLVKNLHPTASLNALGLATVPKDKSFIPTGVTLTAALLYTKNVVTTPPTSWLQLLDPQWRGEIGITTPKKIDSDYPFIAGMITQVAGTNGVAKGERFFSQLKAKGLNVYTTTGQTIHTLTTGKIKLALVQSSAAVGAQHTDPSLAVAYLPSVTASPLEHRRRRQGLQAGEGRSEEIHELRPLTDRAEGHAGRHKAGPLELLPGDRRNRAASHTPGHLHDQGPEHHTVRVGAAAGGHHCLRQARHPCPA